MFHWICPECGREIPPTIRECQACDPSAVAPAAVEPIATAPVVEEVPVAAELLLLAAAPVETARLEPVVEAAVEPVVEPVLKQEAVAAEVPKEPLVELASVIAPELKEVPVVETVKESVVEAASEPEPPIVAAADPVVEAIPEPAPVAAVEPVAEKVPEPEPLAVSATEPVAQAVSEPAPVAQGNEPLAVSEIEPLVLAVSEPAPVGPVGHEPLAVSATEPVALAVSEPAPVAPVEPEPLAVSATEPVTQAVSEPAPVGLVGHEPLAVSEVEPLVLAVSEPVPVAPVEPEPLAVSAAEPVVQAVPEPAPVAAEEPVVEKVPEPEPLVAEAKPEPVVVAAAEPEALAVSATEPVVQAVPEPAPVAAVEPEPLIVAASEPGIQAVPEPEPLADSATEPVAEIVAEPEPLPVVEAIKTPEPQPVIAAVKSVALNGNHPSEASIRLHDLPDPLLALAEEIRAAQAARAAAVAEPSQETNGLRELADAVGMPEPVPAQPVEPVAQSAQPTVFEPVAESAAVEAKAQVESATATALLDPPEFQTARWPTPETAAQVEQVPVALAPPEPQPELQPEPEGPTLPFAPLQNYTPATSRSIQPVPPPNQILSGDASGPRITLPGPTLPPELTRLQEANVVTVIGEPTAQRAKEAIAPKKTGAPGWLVSLGVMLLLLAIGLAILFYLLPHTVADAKPGPTPAEAATVTAPASTSPLAKFIEVTGFRIVTSSDPAKKSEVQYLVVNHSDADISDANIFITLKSVKPGQPPVCRFSFKVPSLAPYESKEMSSPIEKSTRPVSLPDWQELRAEVQISQ